MRSKAPAMTTEALAANGALFFLFLTTVILLRDPKLTAADPGIKKFLKPTRVRLTPENLCKVAHPFSVAAFVSGRIIQEIDSAIHSGRACPGQAAHNISGSLP